MKYWWVSQNGTFTEESSGGYMWSPKHTKNGAKNHFYDNMTRVNVGDVVLSFASSKIQAVGIVTKPAYSAAKPLEFGTAGDAWLNDGWKVEVDYHFLTKNIRPAEHMDSIGPLLPDKYSPLQASGHGNQAYLFALSDVLFTQLSTLIGEEVDAIISEQSDVHIQDEADNRIEAAILTSPELAQTTKEQLVKARRGQGLFKSRVENIEACCRVTGIAQRRHLIASHIKPWRDASNDERLDGNNGLMLAPHIDHLFDKGYISFSDQGELLISNQLKPEVLTLWGVEVSNVGRFNPRQQLYLNYHRQCIFKP